MEKILIVSGSEKASATIVRQLKDIFDQSSISIINSGNEAINSVSYYEYDMVIINCPLPDEYGFDLARYVSGSTMASCVMIVNGDNADSVMERVEKLGVMVISKPLSKDTFSHSLKFMAALRERLLRSRRDDIRPSRKPEEIKTINRAKSALMKYLSFSEQQAHRYIEKQAMDTRSTKLDVALKIIKMYDNQNNQNIN